MAKGSGYKHGGPSGLVPDPQWWLEELRKGIEDRNKKAHVMKWEKWRRWYRGLYNANELPYNVYFKLLRTMIPRVYFRNPSASITPRKRQQGQVDYWVFAQIMEQIDNALYDRMRLKEAMKMSIQDAFMFGTGVPKLGYGGQFNARPDPVGATEAPPDKKHKEQQIEYNSYILPDTPWIMRVPTRRFIVPAFALDWASCRWVAHEERRHIDDVQNDPRFKHVSDLQPGVLTQPGDVDLNKMADQVSLIEIRDKKSGGVFVIAPTQKDKVLYYEEDTLQYDRRLPFFPVQFNPDDDTFWAVPDAQILEPHQIEMNEIRRVCRMHRRISLIKFIIRQGQLTPDSLTKLLSPNEVGAAIEVVKDAPSLADAIKEMQAGDLPAGLLKMDQMEEQLIQELLGLGVNQFGEYAPGSADRSATEAMIVNQAVQIRTDERRDICADRIVDITEHMNYVLLNQWDGEQVVAIAGPEGQRIWVAFKMTDIKSLEYDVKVDPDSAVPETRAVRRQNAMGFYQLFMNDPMFDPYKLRQRTVSEMTGPWNLDLMKSQEQLQQQAMAASQAAGNQPLGQPGQPGSSPSQPIGAQQVIQHLNQRRQRSTPPKMVG